MKPTPENYKFEPHNIWRIKFRQKPDGLLQVVDKVVESPLKVVYERWVLNKD